jgi:hypothetical protein
MTERRGLRLFCDLSAICLRNAKTGCMIWPGYIVKGRPVARLLGHGPVHGARIVAILLSREAERRPDQRWYMACGNALCLAGRHLELGTHQQALACAAAAGRLRRAEADAVARARAARRRMPDFRPLWMVEWARESSQSAAEVGICLGVHRTTVRTWRLGTVRQDQIFGAFEQLRMAA